MKTLRLHITVLFIISGCSSNKFTDYNSIFVVRTNPHPFLVDHSKKLIVNDKNGDVIDEQELYTDPGVGCNSYLFDTDSTFTLIECNGYWYSIAKNNGQIDNLGWRWEQKPPKDLIGTFKRTSGKKEYSLDTISEIELKEVYKFKDPG